MNPDQAFAEFYRRSKDDCLRAVLAAGGDRAGAEEAVAEAFARAWAAWPKVSRHPSPVAWVARTALNHRISRWRRTRREVVLPEALEPHHDDPATDQRADLIVAVRGLPPRQREVVALRYFLDLDTAQTAAALGLAPGTVTTHLHRALATLRTVIDAEQETSA